MHYSANATLGGLNHLPCIPQKDVGMRQHVALLCPAGSLHVPELQIRIAEMIEDTELSVEQNYLCPR